MDLLEVHDLKKHFPIRKGLLSKTKGYVRAVDGVSFNLQKSNDPRDIRKFCTVVLDIKAPKGWQYSLKNYAITEGEINQSKSSISSITLDYGFPTFGEKTIKEEYKGKNYKNKSLKFSYKNVKPEWSPCNAKIPLNIKTTAFISKANSNDSLDIEKINFELQWKKCK